MSDISEIINLSKLIGSKDTLQNDIVEATTLISSMFRQKYIAKLERELKKQKQTHQKNPTKEIQLIQAVKPFINQERHKEIDNITDTLINITTLMDIQKDFMENIKNSKDKDEKEDKKENKEGDKKTDKKAVVSAASTSKNDITDPSIKEDGIYDIDETCLLSMQNTTKTQSTNFLTYALLIAMLMQNKK